MFTFILALHIIVAIAMIGLILIQHGKGADAGAAFGSGASGTVFGARGSANFLTRVTAWLAAAFFVLSLALAYIVHGRSNSESVVEGMGAAPSADAAAPAPAPAAAAEGAEPVVQVPEAKSEEIAPPAEETVPKPQVPQ